VCAGGRAGCGAYLHSVEDVFEDVFPGGEGLPMHLEWIGAWGNTFEKMSCEGVYFVGPQASGMCVSTGLSGNGQKDTQWMSENVKETRMDVCDRTLREFEGGGQRVQGAVCGDTREEESKIAGEREMLYAGLKYTPGSVEKRRREKGGGRVVTTNPCLSLSPTTASSQKKG